MPKLLYMEISETYKCENAKIRIALNVLRNLSDEDTVNFARLRASVISFILAILDFSH